MDLIFDHVTSKIRKIRKPNDLHKKLPKLEAITDMSEFLDQVKTLKKKIINLKDNLVKQKHRESNSDNSSFDKSVAAPLQPSKSSSTPGKDIAVLQQGSKSTTEEVSFAPSSKSVAPLEESKENISKTR